ncbi:hypothetical protein [Ideonella margarita]|uniref:Uncharacterized protein n=1 Tax=Ideonella margarita TaxID=2984191 RepID=A0ABU9C7P1_9BURK
MDITSLLLGLMAATLAITAFQAWRQGCEKRDVRLLGTISGLFGAGTVVSAIL